MKPNFHTQYRPLTSRPFLRGSSYSEYAPGSRLAPYIACFWESYCGSGAEIPEVLVIPDTCIDIIIEIYPESRKLKSHICGLADAPELIKQKQARGTVTTFAVRFYFWAAQLFLDVGLRELYNRTIDFELVDPEGFREFEEFFYLSGTGERIAWMENFLMKRMKKNHYNPNLYNSIDRILNASGGISVKEICEYNCVSQRQLERLFIQNIGISIKRTANLVRYQKVWRDIVSRKQFDVQDAVYRYGFSDQSHLLNEFKRFHGMTPEQAKQVALKNL